MADWKTFRYFNGSTAGEIRERILRIRQLETSPDSCKQKEMLQNGCQEKCVAKDKMNHHPKNKA